MLGRPWWPRATTVAHAGLAAALARHAAAILAEAVSCPIVLYTNRSFSGTNLSPEVIESLLTTPNIRYLKDASANTGNLLTP